MGASVYLFSSARRSAIVSRSQITHSAMTTQRDDEREIEEREDKCVRVRAREMVKVMWSSTERVLGRWQRRMFRRSNQVNQRGDLLGASD